MAGDLHYPNMDEVNETTKVLSTNQDWLEAFSR